MGNISSIWGNEEARDEWETSGREDEEKAMPIQLNCADFGIFNGRADKWIGFKENI
jgi:hypothetical protein